MSNDQPTTPTPPQETKKPNAIKAAWRRFKDRMKLTWIGWFYICARRTWGGSVLLFCLLLSFLPIFMGVFDYLARLPYESYDEMPCKTGALVRVHSVVRGESTGTLLDASGVEYKFFGRHIFGNINKSKITPFLGQEVKVCFVKLASFLPPFYFKEAIHIYYPDGTSNRDGQTRTINEARDGALKWSKNFLLWLTLPILLWLLKRHGREAWRERRVYRESLTSSHSNR